MRSAIASLDDAAFPLLIQQRIVGPGTGIFLLVWDGTVRAVFAHRRLREKPPSGGVSVYSESIAAKPDLVERSRLLLERMKWNGIAMIEYKLDASTGVPYLMEVNGRFWGSLQLAIDAGVAVALDVVTRHDGERGDAGAAAAVERLRHVPENGPGGGAGVRRQRSLVQHAR